MSLLQNLVIFLTISSFISIATSRALPPLNARVENGLAREMSSKVGLVDCWSALTELRSCTNEIVIFFLNGDSYLTIGCCKAIRVITKNCWPTMLTNIGFSSGEADILKGYCDVDAPPPLSTLAPSPFAVSPM